MRKLILMVALVFVGIACGDAVGEMLDVPDVGAQPGDGSGMRFVGKSADTAAANGGIFAMYAACQQSFGAGHRMCTLAEILNTTEMPTLTEGFSWHQQDLSSTPCGGYSLTGSSYRAPAVDELGRFSTPQCGATNTVACCGPK